MRSGIKICVAWGKSIPETKTSAKASKLHLMRQEIARRLVWPQQSQHRDETHGELRARSRTGQGEEFSFNVTAPGCSVKGLWKCNCGSKKADWETVLVWVL